MSSTTSGFSSTSGARLVRRSVFQNADTCVEVLVHSRHPSPTADQSASAKPSSVSSGQSASAASSSVNGWPIRRLAGSDARPISGGDAVKPGVGRDSHCVNEAQRCVNAWAAKLKRLAHEIGKRPAVSHIRPVLTKLELALCSVPDLSSLHQEHHHQDNQCQDNQDYQELQRHVVSLQQQNQQLKTDVDELTAKLQLSEKVIDSASSGDSPNQQVVTSLRTELEATKYQLAKHRKYAKEVKKTKQNLIATIQNMEESQRVQVKRMREEFESQLAQVLQRVTDETDTVSKFKSSADCVEAELAGKEKEISQLKEKLSQRDAEIQQLLSINHTLQNRVAKHVDQLDAAVQCYQQQQHSPSGSLWQKVTTPSSHALSSPPRPQSSSSASSAAVEPPPPFSGDMELPELSLGWLEATLCQHTDEPELLKRLEHARREMDGLSRQLLVRASGDAADNTAGAGTAPLTHGVAQLTV